MSSIRNGRERISTFSRDIALLPQPHGFEGAFEVGEQQAHDLPAAEREHAAKSRESDATRRIFTDESVSDVFGGENQLF